MNDFPATSLVCEVVWQKNNCTDFSYIAKIIWEFWNEGLAQDELFFKRVIYDASRELWSCLRFCNTMGFKDLKESSLTH